MANLSVVGSHSVNGVSALHSDILTKTIFSKFYELQPNKFNNKTNGISHRRFMMQANPGLAQLIDNTIGTDWQTDFEQIKRLEEYAQDSAFLGKQVLILLTGILLYSLSWVLTFRQAAKQFEKYDM